MHGEKGVTRGRDTGSCRGGCRDAELAAAQAILGLWFVLLCLSLLFWEMGEWC